MILLNGQSLQIRDRFRPESMSLNLEERNSTATITIGPEAPAIAVNDWLKDEEEPGAGIIWRVKTVQEQIETGTRTIQLEHVIQYLKDRIMFGEVLPKNMAGGNAEKCTARQAITYILAQDSKWQLGDLAENPSNPYSFNGESLYSALETVTGSLDSVQWEYDLSALPFKLHIRKQPASFSSEMRMSRNITSLRKQIDRTRMYTRHYPIGKNNIHIDGNYTSRNENIWGVIAKVETDQSLDTKEKLQAWSLERLKRHCEPLVTITVTGQDLSADTGEPLDHITVGQKCRVPLPEYGTTITERITKMSWADKIKEPDKVTITMANLIEDVASIVNQQASSSSRSGRTGAKKAEEDHAWFVDTTTHVAMVAEAVAGPGAAQDWSRVSEVIVDGQGIHQRVTRTEGEIVATWAAIEVLDDKIDMEVANAKSDMYAHVEITASHIRSEVNSSKSTIFSTIMQTATNIYTQVGNAKSDTYSKIEQTASSIRSEVNSSKSTIFSTIMQTATNIYTQVANAKSDTYASIEATASSITTQVGAAKSTLFSSIMQTATNIYTQVANAKSDTYASIEATASSIESTVASAKSSLWSGIMQTSTQISLKVSKDGVISAINQTAESITISAGKINLSGYVQATDLTATYIAGILTDTSVLSTRYLYTKSIEVGDGTITVNGYDCDLEDGICALQIVQDGNTYKLQKKHFYSSDWADVGSFSRATSLSGAWGGTVAAGKYYKVTASPQGNSCQSKQLDGMSIRSDKTWAQDKKSFTQTLYVYDEDGVELYEENKSFNTTDSYNAGADSVTVSSVAAPTNQTQDSFTVTATASNGETKTRKYYLVQNGSYVYVCQGSATIGANYTVARFLYTED